MHRKRLCFIIALFVLAALVGGLGWLIYTPIHQVRLNRALIVAVKHNNTKKALALLAEGADPNARDEPPQKLSLWRLLLDELRGKRPAPPTAPTALLMTCWQDRYNLPLIKALIDRGAALEVTDQERRTPLLYATLKDWTTAGSLLIEKGANVNASTTKGYTPLMLAEYKSNKTLVRLLLRKRAKVNVQSIFGDTPLKLAKERRNPAILQMLKQAGAKE